MWKKYFYSRIHNRQVRVFWKNPPKLCSMQHDRDMLLKEMQGPECRYQISFFFFPNLCSHLSFNTKYFVSVQGCRKLIGCWWKIIFPPFSWSGVWWKLMDRWHFIHNFFFFWAWIVQLLNIVGCVPNVKASVEMLAFWETVCTMVDLQFHLIHGCFYSKFNVARSFGHWSYFCRIEFCVHRPTQ